MNTSYKIVYTFNLKTTQPLLEKAVPKFKNGISKEVLVPLFLKAA
jgi:hypothetical protein